VQHRPAVGCREYRYGSFAGRDTDADRDGDADPNADADGDAHADPHANRHAESNPDANRDADPHTDANGHADPDPNADANKHANANGDTAADPSHLITDFTGGLGIDRWLGARHDGPAEIHAARDDTALTHQTVRSNHEPAGGRSLGSSLPAFCGTGGNVRAYDATRAATSAARDRGQLCGAGTTTRVKTCLPRLL
jgi:hypothetical protein